MRVWMIDEWWWRPVAWLLVGANHARDAAHVAAMVRRRAPLGHLEIVSHGRSGVVKLGRDRMRAGAIPDALVRALRESVLPGGTVQFSACDQRLGEALRALSARLPGVRVVGNEARGWPVIPGRLVFRDGRADDG